MYENKVYQRNAPISTEGGIKGAWFKYESGSETHFFSLDEMYNIDDDYYNIPQSTLNIIGYGQLEIRYPVDA